MIGVTQTVSTSAAQPKILLQLAADGGLEGRFEAAPVCHVRETWETPAYQIEERSLSTFDTAVMWTGYGLATLVGGFVGMGVANGGDPVTGTKLFAMFGLPFATVGVVESVRATDRSSALPATDTTYERGLRPCAVDADGLPVRLRRGVDERIVMLSTEFRPLGHPGEGYRYDLVRDEGEKTVRNSVPLQLDGDSLYAVLDGPVVVREIKQAPKAPPAAVVVQSETKAPEATQPAPAPKEALPAVVPTAVSPAPVAAVSPVTPAPAPADPAPQAVAAAESVPVAEAAPQPKPEAVKAGTTEAASPVAHSTAAPLAPAACTVKLSQYGKVPSTFYEQPVEVYRVQKGDWLSKVAQRLWGEAAEYRQLHLLNAALVKDADLVYAGDEIKVPQAPKTWVEWQRGADACVEKQ
jgi:LysM repeat protein